MSARLCKVGFANVLPFPPTNPTQTLSLCRISRWVYWEIHLVSPRFSQVLMCKGGRNEHRPPKANLVYYLRAQHWLNAQWMKDPVAELSGGGFSWC